MIIVKRSSGYPYLMELLSLSIRCNRSRDWFKLTITGLNVNYF